MTQLLVLLRIFADIFIPVPAGKGLFTKPRRPILSHRVIQKPIYTQVVAQRR